MCTDISINYEEIVLLVTQQMATSIEDTMKKPLGPELFLKPIKIIFGFFLFIISSYWGYLACIKVYTPPVGTRLQYRYGDDFKGNIEVMALTLCPEKFNHYRFLEGKYFSCTILVP